MTVSGMRKDPADGAAPDAVGVRSLAVQLDGAVPTADGRPWWPRVAVPRWTLLAAEFGLDVRDATWDTLDEQRDQDDNYAGTVTVGGCRIDLLVDRDHWARVAPEYHYLL